MEEQALCKFDGFVIVCLRRSFCSSSFAVGLTDLDTKRVGNGNDVARLLARLTLHFSGSI